MLIFHFETHVIKHGSHYLDLPSIIHLHKGFKTELPLMTYIMSYPDKVLQLYQRINHFFGVFFQLALSFDITMWYLAFHDHINADN